MLFISWLAVAEVPTFAMISKGIFRNGYFELVHSGLCSGIFYFLCVMLSLRYGIWRLFFNLSFDRAMIYHQICAYIAILLCILHVYSNIYSSFNYYGITGYICWISTIIMSILGILLRRKYYNTFFIYSHWFFIIIVLVSGILHNAILIVVATPIFTIDFIIRIMDNYWYTTTLTNIRVIDNDRIVCIEFEKKGFKYVAGQYAFINIPKIGLLEWHPFTLSCYPGQNNNKLSMHIKVEGNWTSKLSIWMKSIQTQPEFWKDTRINIEGPHGELMLPKPLHKYQHILFISGGIGITPCESLFNQLVSDLVYNKQLKGAKVNKIEFIFTTRSKAMINEFANRNAGWKIVNEIRTGSMNPFSNIQQQNENYLFSQKSRITQRSMFRRMSDINKYQSHSKQKRESVKLTKNDIAPEYFTAETKFIKKSTLNDSMDSNKDIKKKRKLKKRKSLWEGMMIDSDTDSDWSDNEPSRQELSMDDEDMNVNEFTIKNSTHITRIKDESLRKAYKKNWSFINFDRPKINKLILEARGNVKKSGDIAVLTSGPKSMINDCIKWSHELGIACHYEIFNW